MAKHTEIPHIIHQTWKSAEVPPRWRAWVESWQRHHPSWEYRLWTDEDNRDFLHRHYPWFLPVYDGYPKGIMRADAIRYFLLDHFGGVYVDLDFECLRPLNGLIGGHGLILGYEPEAHAGMGLARERRIERIVGNAFLASRPRHPLWAHIHRELVRTHKETDVLDATGPFFLTRAMERAPGAESVTVLEPELLYPVPSPHAATQPAREGADLSSAYAVHHWAGSWIEPSCPAGLPPGTEIRFWTSQNMRPLATGMLNVDAQRKQWAAGAPAPKVSCLMVTQDRPSLARRAVACFTSQTYPDLELVVIDDGTSDTLGHYIGSLNDPRINYLRLPPENKTLGELRNVAVEQAGGAYLCQWDDDDLYDPERVEVQMAAMLALGAEACFLARERLWWPARRKLAISRHRVWEGSMICSRSRMPSYPHLRRGEDTQAVAQVAGSCRLAAIDVPHLYTYVFHGGNTFGASHFAGHFDAATHLYGDPGVSALEEAPARAAEQPARPSLPGREGKHAAGPGTRPGSGASVQEAAGLPRILVLTPVRDAAAHLPRYLDGLRALEYPGEALSLGLLEGDSLDDTWRLLQAARPELEAAYRRVTLVQQDAGFRSPLPRWDPRIQRGRRSALARARNHLLSRALTDEDWVLWLDVDVTSYPPDLIQRLLGTGKDIVVPSCVTEPSGPAFDLNTFVLKPGSDELDWSQWMRDGILQPPRGFGRIYLDQLRNSGLVQVDAVGGTALLIRADLHRDGLVFPAAPYKNMIETEGLAALARDMGHACWAVPDLEIVHPHHSG
ncbi:glycosyltransferase [Streptomyces sp. NPDC056480]|uniref:glycosyltransferase n=1 Tax=Streptomyces sp. NPDC056480 TaxID=3345833 RepID=UPI0036ACF99F